MLMGSVSMGLMNVVAKLIREWTKVTALQTSLFRAFGMTYFSYLYCKSNKIDILSIPKPVATLLFMRCVFGYISMTAFFISIHMLPFSLAVALSFT
jgi:drug/metabolite transporter (DMT)-like permease